MNKMIETFRLIKQTLKKEGFNYDQIMEDLGQVNAFEKRQRGEKFSFNEHIKGLILALLSNQRIWRQIAENLDVVSEIFYNYDYQLLLKADSQEIIKEVKTNKLGNRNINSQINNLKYNIGILRKIEKDFGSLDKFVESNSAEVIAITLSDNNSKYKIKQLGLTLATEYLKNIGIRIIKPDAHIMRICGHERLGFFLPNETEKSAIVKFQNFSKEFGYNETYVDNLLWTFCARGYGEICGDIPKCNLCLVGENNLCNYNKR